MGASVPTAPPVLPLMLHFFRINICANNLGITASFNVKHKQVVAIVHDQAANYESTSHLLEEDRGRKHLKCLGHCLQLSVKSGLSIYQIEQMIIVALKIVGHFRHSTTASEALK